MATTLWEWQDGTALSDGFNTVALASDGSSVLTGFNNRNVTGVSTYWMAVKLDADGTILWSWQDDILGDENDLVYAAAIDEDGSVVMAGAGADDFQVIKLDADGSFVWRFQDGAIGSTSTADGIAIGDDASIVVVGGTFGEWDTPVNGDRDMAAFKLDADGNLLWKWQDGTVGYDYAFDVAMANDGAVVMASKSNGDFVDVGASASGYSTFASIADGYNFVAVKLDSEGAEVWRWQDGPTGESNALYSVSMTEDGSFVMVGRCEGSWSGASIGDLDFAAVKLDADGNEVWRWQNGTSGTDSLQTSTARADGTVVLGGYTQGAWSGSVEGGVDFAIVVLDADGEEIWRWQDGSAAEGDISGNDYVNDVSADSDGRVVLVGQTYGSYAATYLGNSDYVAIMLNTSALDTPSSTTPFLSPTPTPAPPSTATSASPVTPTALTPAPLPASTSITPPTTAQETSDVASIAAGVASAVAGAALIALGLCLLKRKRARKNASVRQVHPPVVAVFRDNQSPAHQHNPASPPPPYRPTAAAPQQHLAHPPPPYQHATAACQQPVAQLAPPYLHTAAAATAGVVAAGGADTHSGGSCVISPHPAAVRGVAQHAANANLQAGKDVSGGGSGDAVDDYSRLTGHSEPSASADKPSGPGRVAQDGAGGVSVDRALIVTSSTGNISTGERNAFTPAYGGSGVACTSFTTDEPRPTFDEIGVSSTTDGRKSTGGPGLGRAVGEAALELARNCLIPGVSEAASAVSILVDLVTGNQDTKNGTEPSLRRCRSIVLMLQRAAKVLGKGGDTTGQEERAMMEDVHDAIFDLVELIKTYKSKNRLSQLLMSTLFRRRQDEMGAVVDRAILSLQLGLQVQVGNDVSAFRDGMHLYQGSMEEAQSKSLAEARNARRQRKLDKLEIPEDHVAVTEELLGKGGFGEVYLADYNGRNAAAKVMHISQNLGRRGDNDVTDESTEGQVERRNEMSQRKSFLIELDTMVRLRSPYTVNVYGAVTAKRDRLILVMELLSGGDLRTFLSNRERPLPEPQSRQIIADICAGMAFLHRKEAVHGDLKSANVLLDGAGRAKIGDFGTSRWTQHTMSTGLATFTTKSSKNTQMSLAWSAPEVLHAAGSTYASDVYSFGIVVWEVLSREVPWENVTHPKEIYIRVVLNDLRPDIPEGAPLEIADVARACWVDKPTDRPTFSAMMENMKANRWNP